MLIEDGIGKGYKAEVDSENHLRVNAVAQSLLRHINLDHGEAYSMVFEDASAAAGADDSLLYILNLSDKNLIISRISWYSDTANEWTFKVGVAATATTGGNITAVTPVNLNVASALSAEGTFLTDDGDTMILTGGSEIAKVYLAVSTQYTLDFVPEIVLAKNDAFGMFKLTAGVDTFVGHLIFGYHE